MKLSPGAEAHVRVLKVGTLPPPIHWPPLPCLMTALVRREAVTSAGSESRPGSWSPRGQGESVARRGQTSNLLTELELAENGVMLIQIIRYCRADSCPTVSRHRLIFSKPNLCVARLARPAWAPGSVIRAPGLGQVRHNN